MAIGVVTGLLFRIASKRDEFTDDIVMVNFLGVTDLPNVPSILTSSLNTTNPQKKPTRVRNTFDPAV